MKQVMDIELPADCGNAPRIVIVGDFVAHWASGDTDAVAEWLSDDVSWTIIGADVHTGPGTAEAATPSIRAELLVVQSIVTHGRLASCDGYLEAGTKRVAFSHAIRFAGAAKSAKIVELRTYCIETA